MISRLTFSAAVFAVLAAATLAFATESHAPARQEATGQGAVAGNPVVVMPRVEIVGRRPR